MTCEPYTKTAEESDIFLFLVFFITIDESILSRLSKSLKLVQKHVSTKTELENFISKNSKNHSDILYIVDKKIWITFSVTTSILVYILSFSKGATKNEQNIALYGIQITLIRLYKLNK